MKAVENIKSPSSVNISIFILLVTILWVPLLSMITGFGLSAGSTEKRMMARVPSILKIKTEGFNSFTADMEKYFNDNFGFRETLISINSRIALYLLNTMINDNVIIGKDGFYYYRQTIDDYRNAVPFSPEALAFLKNTLARRQEWLAEKNISYLYTIAPNKATAYPDFLPSWINKKNNVNRYDQVAELFKDSKKSFFLDLRPVLTGRKSTRLLYHLTDTHWNDFGAFVAYSAIIRKVQTIYPNLPILSENDFVIEDIPFFLGDLTGMLGGFPKVTIQSLKPKKPFRATPSSTSSKRFGEVWVKEQNSPELPSVVIFGDSFAMTALKDYLSESFRRTVVIRADVGAFEPDLIIKEKPDLVIQETVERFLLLPFEGNSF